MTEQRYGVKDCGDPNTKYGKYVVYNTWGNPFHKKEFPDPDMLNLYFDERTMEGGFYWSGVVMHKPTPTDAVAWKPHRHDFVEYIILMGTVPGDPKDLGGEVDFYLDDELHTVTHSCVITVPPGLWHCPFYFRRVDHPIVFNTCSKAPILYEHINHDPKWAHLADPPQIDEIID